MENNLTTSETVSEIFKALSAFQGEINNPKAATYNKQTDSYYAKIDNYLKMLKPILAKHGLSIIQNIWTENLMRFPEVEPNRMSVPEEYVEVFCQTHLFHLSGEFIISGVMQAGGYQYLKGGAKRYCIQGTGSAITSLRRYQLGPFLGIAGEEDDDGNDGSGGVDDPIANAEACTKVYAELRDLLDDKKAKSMIFKHFGTEDILKLTESQVATLNGHVTAQKAKRAKKIAELAAVKKKAAELKAKEKPEETAPVEKELTDEEQFEMAGGELPWGEE